MIRNRVLLVGIMGIAYMLVHAKPMRQVAIVRIGVIPMGRDILLRLVDLAIRVVQRKDAELITVSAETIVQNPVDLVAHLFPVGVVVIVVVIVEPLVASIPSRNVGALCAVTAVDLAVQKHCLILTPATISVHELLQVRAVEQ